VNVAFWTVRMCVAFAALMSLPFSWRVSLVIVMSGVLDFITLLGMIVSGPAVWFHAAWLFSFGWMTGLSLTVRVERLRASDLPWLSFTVLVALKAPLVADPVLINVFSRGWLPLLVTTTTFPLGLLAGTHTVLSWRRLTR
jgi:hypothetical protein